MTYVCKQDCTLVVEHFSSLLQLVKSLLQLTRLWVFQMDNFLVESGIELCYFIAFLTGSLEIFSAAILRV